MSEQSLYQQQKKTKPLIEEIIPEYIDGDMKNAVLDFVAWLRENNMKPTWVLTNSWKAVCKGRALYYIRMVDCEWKKEFGKYWVITLYFDHLDKYEDIIFNENSQNIIINNISYCKSCKECAPGNKVTVFGKEVNVCANVPMTWIWDADKPKIEIIKRLLELEKLARTEKVR